MAKCRGVEAFEAAERQIKGQKKQKQASARLAGLHKEKVGGLTCWDNHTWYSRLYKPHESCSRKLQCNA